MSRSLINDLGEQNYDNIVVDTTFPVKRTVVTLKSGQGTLQPGTVIGKDADGLGVVLDGTNATTPDCVLGEIIDTGEAVDPSVPVVVLISGTLNRNMLIFGGAETADKHEDALRKLNIYLKEVI